MIKLVFILGLFSLVRFPVEASVPWPAHTFDFNVKTINFNEWEEEKLNRSLVLLKKVIKSEAFREKVNNHQLEGEVLFHMNKGFTNSDIYWLILSGPEELSPKRNNKMDIELELYHDPDSNVLAYTRRSSKRIFLNRKYFESLNLAELAGNIFHEWLHKVGFDHEVERTPLRPFSVPYALGYIVRDIGLETYNFLPSFL